MNHTRLGRVLSLIRKGNNTDTWRRPCEDRGKNWSCAAASQGKLLKPSEAERGE